MEGVRKLYAGLSVCLCSQTGVCNAANCLARVAGTLASDKPSGGVGAVLDGTRAIAADRQMSERNDAFASRAAGIYGRSVHVFHESSCAQLTATRLPLSDDTDMLQWPSLSCSMLSLRHPALAVLTNETDYRRCSHKATVFAFLDHDLRRRSLCCVT